MSGFDFGRGYQQVSLEGIEVRLAIGAFRAEKAAPQRVTVAVDLWRRQARPFAGRVLAECMDYHRLFRLVTEEWPRWSHRDLLEHWAEELLTACFADPQVEAARVRLGKPAIYGGRALPSLTVFRLRGEQEGAAPAAGG